MLLKLNLGKVKCTKAKRATAKFANDTVAECKCLKPRFAAITLAEATVAK